MFSTCTIKTILLDERDCQSIEKGFEINTEEQKKLHYCSTAFLMAIEAIIERFTDM